MRFLFFPEASLLPEDDNSFVQTLQLNPLERLRKDASKLTHERMKEAQLCERSLRVMDKWRATEASYFEVPTELGPQTTQLSKPGYHPHKAQQLKALRDNISYYEPRAPPPRPREPESVLDAACRKAQAEAHHAAQLREAGFDTEIAKALGARQPGWAETRVGVVGDVGAALFAKAEVDPHELLAARSRRLDEIDVDEAPEDWETVSSGDKCRDGEEAQAYHHPAGRAPSHCGSDSDSASTLSSKSSAASVLSVHIAEEFNRLHERKAVPAPMPLTNIIQGCAADVAEALLSANVFREDGECEASAEQETVEGLKEVLVVFSSMKGTLALLRTLLESLHSEDLVMSAAELSSHTLTRRKTQQLNDNEMEDGFKELIQTRMTLAKPASKEVSFGDMMLLSMRINELIQGLLEHQTDQAADWRKWLKRVEDADLAIREFIEWFNTAGLKDDVEMMEVSEQLMQEALQRHKLHCVEGLQHFHLRMVDKSEGLEDLRTAKRRREARLDEEQQRLEEERAAARRRERMRMVKSLETKLEDQWREVKNKAKNQQVRKEMGLVDDVAPPAPSVAQAAPNAHLSEIIQTVNEKRSKLVATVEEFVLTAMKLDEELEQKLILEQEAPGRRRSLELQAMQHLRDGTKGVSPSTTMRRSDEEAVDSPTQGGIEWDQQQELIKQTQAQVQESRKKQLALQREKATLCSSLNALTCDVSGLYEKAKTALGLTAREQPKGDKKRNSIEITESRMDRFHMEELLQEKRDDLEKLVAKATEYSEWSKEQNLRWDFDATTMDLFCLENARKPLHQALLKMLQHQNSIERQKSSDGSAPKQASSVLLRVEEMYQVLEHGLQQDQQLRAEARARGKALALPGPGPLEQALSRVQDYVAKEIASGGMLRRQARRGTGFRVAGRRGAPTFAIAHSRQVTYSFTRTSTQGLFVDTITQTHCNFGVP